MKAGRWQIAPPDSNLAAELARSLRVPPLLAQCLLNRGCTPENAAEYLDPRLSRLTDPFALPGMDRAVDRLLQARSNREPLVIFGDYDVDGVASVALLALFLGRLGWNPDYYLPHRLEEGYGLSADGVRNCLRQFPARLLLAVDCGSASHALIAELAAAGVEAIVLDHHQLSDPAPAAAALVNPRLPGTPAACAQLCSGGLAFKLAHAILKRARALGWPEASEIDMRDFLDFVALATIADLVPLTGENRIFARCGLAKLAVTQRPGLQALKRAAGAGSPVSAREVAFQLAPRLNAAGRLETALDALELLLTVDPARAAALAETLDRRNQERRALEERIAAEAIAAVRARFDPARDFAIVEGHESWHLGVVGIVASRVVREFHRPAIILGGDGPDGWRGSGRSIEGLDLASALRQCADLLLRHGGHAMAAGVTLPSANVPEFRARLNECARAALPPDALQPLLRLDAEAPLRDLTFPVLELFGRIEPTGQGNAPVRLAARGLSLRGPVRRIGARQAHLRFSVTDGGTTLAAVWWGAPDHAEAGLAGRFDLAFAPELNEFNGTCGIQLRVLDIRPDA